MPPRAAASRSARFAARIRAPRSPHRPGDRGERLPRCAAPALATHARGLARLSGDVVASRLASALLPLQNHEIIPVDDFVRFLYPSLASMSALRLPRILRRSPPRSRRRDPGRTRRRPRRRRSPCRRRETCRSTRTMPDGSRLFRRRRARARAPSSMTSVPRPHRVGDPVLAAGEPVGRRDEQRPDVGAGERRARTTSDPRPAATTVGTPLFPAIRRPHLRRHAAGADAPTSSRPPPAPRDRCRARSGCGPPAGIGVAHAFDVGEDDERVGADEVRRQRGEAVVVAELDLLGGDGVVLVDDRHDAELEQRAQREARRQEAPAIAHVVVGEQDLADRDAVRARTRAPSPASGGSGRRRRRPAGAAAPSGAPPGRARGGRARSRPTRRRRR